MKSSTRPFRVPRRLGLAGVVVLLLVLAGSRTPLQAHCDTLEGPVVTAARTALDQGDATPVLRWVLPREEAEIREAFARTLAVRRQGEEARELADQWFFENLVRLHRQGEGFPTPASSQLAPRSILQSEPPMRR